MANLSKMLYSALSKRTPFYVISHERSGTHLALNLCYRNLYVRQAFSDFKVFHRDQPDSASASRHWSICSSSFRNATTKGGLIKCHCDHVVFDRFLPKAPVVYVLRDPRDTLLSFHRFLNSDEFHANNPGLTHLRCASLSDFLRRPLDPFLRYGFSVDGGAKDVVDRWARHARGWMHAPRVLIVRFEHLRAHSRSCIWRIAWHVRALPRARLTPYKLGEKGAILPGSGEVGGWKNHFSKADLDHLTSRLEENGIIPGEVFA